MNADQLRRWRYNRMPTVELLTRARQQPQDLLLLKATGIRLLNEGRADEAEPLLVPSAEAHPADAELNILAGRAEALAGDPQRAAHLIDKALEAAPENADIRFWAAQFLYQRGHKELAEKIFFEVTQLDPHRGDAWVSLAEISLNAMDYSSALKRLDEAERLTPTGDVAYLRASALKELGRRDEAEAAARVAVARKPTAATYALLGELVQQSPSDARLHEAQGYLQKALAEEPTNLDTQKLLAINYRDLGEHAQAVKVLRHMLRQEPAMTEGYMLLSQSYEALGKHDLAEKTLSIFRRLQPLQDKVDYAKHHVSLGHGSATTQLAYARALLALGRRDLATDVIEKIWFKSPANTEVKAMARLAQGPLLIHIPPLPPDATGDAP
ncbi:MAG: tetratricopeptide repeat protein [Abitibacteriaceae bacterium]|nr:tetratricopeptide repeat protein [Abditibacteriaceae bacterium]